MKSKTADKAEKKDTVKKLISVKKNRAIKIIYWTVQGLTLTTLLATIIMFFIRDGAGLETTASQVFMCVLALLTFNVPIFLERKFKIYIPPYITILLYVLMFSHAILGEIYRAYDNISVFDKLLHTTSGVIIALVSFSIVSILNNLPSSKTKLSPFFLVLFAFCFTMTSEYVWEIFEYLADSFVGTNMQRWQDSLVGVIPSLPNAAGEFIHSTPRGNGLNDTMGDMMVNVAGALGVCIYGYVGMKLRPNWFSGIVIMKYEDVVEYNIDVMKENNLIDKTVEREELINLAATEKLAEHLSIPKEKLNELKSEIINTKNRTTLDEEMEEEAKAKEERRRKNKEEHEKKKP